MRLLPNGSWNGNGRNGNGNGRYQSPDRRVSPADLWSHRFAAWGSLAVTLLVFSLLVYVVIATSRFTDVQTFNGLVETIKNMSIAVLGYWVGNSNAKQRQDDALASTAVKQTETNAAAITALATSVPAAAVPTTTSKVDATAGTAETVTEAAGNNALSEEEKGKKDGKDEADEADAERK